MRSAPNLALTLFFLAAASAQDLDPTLLAGLRARSIGPAAMSGRIGAVAGVPGDPTTIWVGAASGGVWKSTDGGVRFTPVFDDQDCTSVGAIAIDPRSPDVVWVGTGEGNPRNSASVGRGVYRTRDGGRTWQKLGLEKTHHVHRIVLHPRDPDTAFVAALGTMWGENEERGLFRTRDGGKTWEKVLYVDERTGCCDVVMDPRNPDKLFAGMWDFRRQPHTFRSGGPGSGLHRSLDGGTTWQRIEPHDGIPDGDLGKSCFQIAGSNPDIVYVLLEAKKSALLRSDDGGFSFRTVNSGEDVATRPFYFCDIRVDPHDENRLYNLAVVVDVSTDGGRNFRSLVGWGAAHPDHHSMWIDPIDPRRIVIGNDGGVYQSQDRGGSWRFCSNLPLAQFYHVAVDREVPYHVYGGLQDNGSWRGPSSVWENGGIRNQHWQEVCFGDGFATLPDPEDSMRGYAMSQGGALVRFDLRTGQQKSIRPPAPDGTELRFHWNAAIAQDPFDPASVFYGSQFVHHSPDRGESWRIVSPDLTTDNAEWQRQDESGGLSIDVTGAENHCTILTIAPSAVQRGVIWAGTDDGRVQVTQDGGTTWRSVEERIYDLPRNTWCPHIEPSKFRAGTAYAVFDDHRRANWTPYVYRTDDFGESWVSLRTDAIDGYCLSIEQDPVREDLLFLGTEFGLWFTIDGGQSWHPFRHGVPTCSAMALVVHPEQGDLVVATHGRSIFVVDDITPLRTLTPAMLQQKLHVFPPQDAIQWISRQTGGSRFPGETEFRGDNRDRGAFVHVIATADELAHPDAKTERERKAARRAAKADAEKLTAKPATGKPPAAAAGAEATEQEKPAPEQEPAQEPANEPAAKAAQEPAKDPGKEVAQDPAEQTAAPKSPKEAPKDQATVEVRDAQGALVRTFRSPLKLGLNRIVWRLERDGQPGPQRDLQVEAPELPPPGRQVLPGEYELTVRFQGEEQRTKVRVLPDPRLSWNEAAARAKDEAMQQRDAIMADLRDALQRLARHARDLRTVEQRLQLEPKSPAGGGEDPFAALRKALSAAQQEQKKFEETLWGPSDVQGVVRGAGAMSDVFEQTGKLTNTADAPNPTEQQALERARERATAVIASIDAHLEGSARTFRAAVEQSGLGLLSPPAK